MKGIFQCVAVCCSVLQRVAVCCSVLLVLLLLARWAFGAHEGYIEVCCSVLQRIAACCSVLQCVAGVAVVGTLGLWSS